MNKMESTSGSRQHLGAEDFEFDAIPYQARIQYGPDKLQHADLRLPSGTGPFPVAVVIHGGCWSGLHRYQHVERVAQSLTKKGWASWNMSHRQAVDPGGGWPGTFLDIAAGIDSLRSEEAEYSLDLSTVVTIGHSAGGHLALWAATRTRIPVESDLYLPNPVSISGTVSLAGIADLEAHSKQ